MNDLENLTTAYGSKALMQKVAKEQFAILNNSLGDVLYWISPIKNDPIKQYKEYQLNGPICKEFGYQKDVFDGFWPSRQPQWDGIALGESGTLYLFEAKSHKGEISRRKKRMSNEINERTIKNDIMIEKSIMSIASYLIEAKENKNFKTVWCESYYQIANRLAFLFKMREIVENHSFHWKEKPINNVCLVFLLFCNDPYWKGMALTEDEWIKYLTIILKRMGISYNLEDSNTITCPKEKSIRFLFPNANEL